MKRFSGRLCLPSAIVVLYEGGHAGAAEVGRRFRSSCLSLGAPKRPSESDRPFGWERARGRRRCRRAELGRVGIGATQ
jgi:hypothetical protein